MGDYAEYVHTRFPSTVPEHDSRWVLMWTHPFIKYPRQNPCPSRFPLCTRFYFVRDDKKKKKKKNRLRRSQVEHKFPTISNPGYLKINPRYVKLYPVSLGFVYCFSGIYCACYLESPAICDRSPGLNLGL